MDTARMDMARFPEGTKEIPYPHRRFIWPRGEIEIHVELDRAQVHEPPMIRGWCPMRVALQTPGAVHWSYRRLDPRQFYDPPPAPKSKWD